MTLKGRVFPYNLTVFCLKKNGEISQTPITSGMVVPVKTALFTMVNTDPKCFWLTNFLETLLVQAGFSKADSSDSSNRIDPPVPKNDGGVATFDVVGWFFDVGLIR